MRTNKTHKPNGDIYFMGVRVYIGHSGQIPRWLMLLGTLVSFPVILLILTLALGADSLL